MILKGIIDEDFVNYKLPCITLEFPYCSFKCDKECGKPVCQNSSLATTPNIEISSAKIIQRYMNNPITEAICFQGLEPLDSFEDVIRLIHNFRYQYKCSDDIIIYTGYTEHEVKDKFKMNHWEYSNIIIKFGRYIPNQKTHFDKTLGVYLTSDNQYAKKIS